MDAEATIQQIHARLTGVMKIITNIMTPEGRKIVVCWRRPDGTSCMVWGDSLDESLRKAALLEEEFGEAAAAAPSC